MQLAWEIALCVAFSLGGGWLLSRAAAAMCHRTFPILPAMAACAAIAAWAIAVVFGTLALSLSLGLGWALLALAIVDYFVFRLPNVITLPLIAIGILASAILPGESVLQSAGAAAAGYLALWGIAAVYRRVRKREGLGMGDAKLAAAAGAWLGLAALPSALLLASVAGIAWVGASALYRGRAALSERIAFGVPLCASIWVVWLYGPFAIATGN